MKLQLTRWSWIVNLKSWQTLVVQRRGSIKNPFFLLWNISVKCTKSSSQIVLSNYDEIIFEDFFVLGNYQIYFDLLQPRFDVGSYIRNLSSFLFLLIVLFSRAVSRSTMFVIK
jgi:hypothetical protein